MSFPRAWLTPDNPPPPTSFCRRLRIPESEEWGAIVRGCLLLLAEEQNWELFGTMTPAEAAELSWQMWQEFVAESDVCMIGAIVAYATLIPPNGCLACDGANHLRVDFPDLYSKLATAFIIDADNFVTPDLRDRVVVGVGASYAMNDSGGQDAVTLTVPEMPSHSHTDLGHTHTESIAVPIINLLDVGVPTPGADPGIGVTGIGNANISSTGGDGAHENRQPYRALGYAIVAR